eukprot:4872055-Amphidinium_carterae.1
MLVIKQPPPDHQRKHQKHFGKLAQNLFLASQSDSACKRLRLSEVRRVCRFDFPLQWEALVRFFIAQLQECEQQVISHKACCIHKCV